MNRVLRILLTSNYLNIFGFSLFSPFYALFTQRIDNNVLLVGGSWGIYMIVAGLLMLLFGKFEDQIKNKEFIVFAGYFILALGILSYIFVSSVLELYLVQVVNAVGLSILTPAWKALYTKLTDKGSEAREWSWYDGGNMILIGIGALNGGYIIKLFGFNALFIIIFLIQILAAILSLQLMKKAGR